MELIPVVCSQRVNIDHLNTRVEDAGYLPMQADHRIQALMLDWAGTTVDYGSRAPAQVFQEVFRRRGISVTAAQARGPMGMAKRDHIAAVAAFPEVAAAWQARFGSPCSEADIDELYAEFLPLQQAILAAHADVIPGVPEMVAACRTRGIKIGSSTGYTRALMEVVIPLAKQQGYFADCVLCADDTPQGRPAPYMIYQAAVQLQVYPLWTVVAVDDTPVGIAAGRQAGCWTVGITRTGNGVGLSAAELATLPAAEVQSLCDRAAEPLRAAGAHLILESAADLLPALAEFEQRLHRGERP